MKQQLNETKTDAELNVLYRDRESEGGESCIRRLYKMKETSMQKEINELRDKLDTEKMVFSKIKEYISKKSEFMNKM